MHFEGIFWEILGTHLSLDTFSSIRLVVKQEGGGASTY